MMFLIKWFGRPSTGCSLVLKAMQLPEYHPLLLDALKNEKKTSTLADR